MKIYALKDRFDRLSRKLIYILLAVFFLVRIIYMQRYHLLIWDEAVYLSMGKYLFSFGQIGIWEIFRPTLLPTILGLGHSLGINPVFFGEIAAIIFSGGLIYLTYLISKNLFSQKVGLLAAFFLAITPIFFLYSSYILTGIPSMFFVLAALYFLTKTEIGKKEYILCGVFAGLAFLTRFPHGLFLAFILLFFGIKFLFHRVRKNFYPIIYIFLSFLIVQIPFLIFNFLMYRHDTGKIWHALFRPWIYAWSHQYNPAEMVGQKFFYFTQLLQYNFWLVFAIVGIVFYFIARKYKKQSVNLMMGIFLLYFSYFNYIPNKQSRFMIAFLPYLCILASYGLFELIKGMTKDRNYKHASVIILGIVVLFSFLLIIPTDKAYYFWRPIAAPSIVTDFYEYFKDDTSRETPLKILTTNPVPAAYVDAKFEPIYFSLQTAYKSYENFGYDYVIYSTETYYCAPEDDDCREEINDFFKLVSSENDLIFTKKYKTRTNYIYKKPDVIFHQ